MPEGEIDIPERIEPEGLRAPDELSVTAIAPKRVLMVGSCLAEVWAGMMKGLPTSCETELYLIAQALPAAPLLPPQSYDFQIVQPALRYVLPDAAFARLSQDDTAGHEQLFSHTVQKMRHSLAEALRWNRQFGILTFVFPFVVPMQNPVGRLLPRYDLRNPVYFVEQLNEALGRDLQALQNVHLFDLNEVFSTYGRRMVQEDVFMAINHGGLIGDFDFDLDRNRLESPRRASEMFKPDVGFVLSAAWRELVSAYRTVRRVDLVKLVVVDLDDTLWRGVVGELSPDELPTSEGWPLGFWETLLVLKRRGLLLAVISKNDPERVFAVWDTIFRGQVLRTDFVSLRINWRTKAENLRDVIEAVNVLPESVAYIDDNPVERAAIKGAFPDVRVLGGTPIGWRRILLWSAETQVPVITAESVSRTEMVLAQVTRDESRHNTSHQEFLASLHVVVNLTEIATVEHPRFQRALELVNKTNQFNTTGKRWSVEDCLSAFKNGARFHAWEVTDKYSGYGLVGVAIVQAERILQLVMSCRVIGLDTEVAVLARLIQMSERNGVPRISANLEETERNLPCRSLFPRCGFLPDDHGWTRATSSALEGPRHISFREPETPEAGAALRREAGANPGATQRPENSPSGATGSLPTEAFLLSLDIPDSAALIYNIIFGLETGNEAWHLRDGWGQAEARHRWTSGNRSGMRFASPRHNDLIIEFDFWPFIQRPHVPRQRLYIRANDTDIGCLDITGSCKQAVHVQASAFMNSELNLHFRHPDAARPADVGPTPDTRVLALCFRSVRVYSLI